MSLTVYISSPRHVSFHPTSKDSICGAHGREMEACTCVTYIAKSNNGSMEMTNQTCWSRLCKGGWWKWNTPFYESLSLLFGWHEDMAIWLYIFFLGPSVSKVFFWVMLLGHAIFSLFFFSIAHASIERYERERERSLNMEFYFVDGWNMVANFQCRSLACGVHMILIKQVWKTSH